MTWPTVAPFACARPHPNAGPDVVCLRSRHHPGDHRAHEGNRLLEWPDPPASELPEAPLLAPPRLIPPPFELDKARVTVLEPLEVRGWRDTAGVALVWLVVAVVATGWPAVLVLLWRAAL